MIGIEGRAWRPLAALAQALAIAMAAALACASPDVATAAPNTPQGRYANVNGIRMYYVVRGEGPVLVLLHGGGGSGEQFGRQVPAFEKHFRLVVPDMCAQGRTSDRSGPLTYHAMAEDVIALMNLLGVKRFDVMGWSDGGDTGLDLAIHHPDRLRRLVTFGANFSPSGLNPADVAWNDTAGSSGGTRAPLVAREGVSISAMPTRGNTPSKFGSSSRMRWMSGGCVSIK